MSSLLEVSGLSVTFDGFKAINNLSFRIGKPELRAIIGPNGAGKTTLMDIITGKTQPDSGYIKWGQKNLNLIGLSEAKIAQQGIGRKFQKPTVFENLTIFENLELAMDGPKNVVVTLFAKLTKNQINSIEVVLDKIGLISEQDKLAGLLSHGQKQWLEIGMLIIQNAQLLLIDEPAAGMTHQEMEKTIALLQSLKKNHTVIVVEHDMDFVRSLNCPVIVLHQGKVLAEGTMDDVQNNAKVIEVYLGEEND